MMEFYTLSDAARKGSISNFIDSDVICFKRILKDEEVLVIINVRNRDVDFDIPADLQSTRWTDAISDGDITLTETLTLSPYKFFILKN